jgi:hypothetical protein
MVRTASVLLMIPMVCKIATPEPRKNTSLLQLLTAMANEDQVFEDEEEYEEREVNYVRHEWQA